MNAIPARLFRISFSGELAYELNVPADFGEQAWLELLEAERPLRIGAHLVNEKQKLDSVSQSLGHVSATTYSPSLDENIALGLLMDGASRHGEEITAYSPVHNEKIRVEVCHPVFIDREGELVRA